ncbi:MAG: metallophosphatase domain-containing protein [bacterium]
MKIAFISDTHSKHKYLENLFTLPPADIIIHSGDVSSIGKSYEIENFLNWFSNLNQYDHKIFIAGNHDFLFERYKLFSNEILKQYKNVHYLEDSGIIINNINIWGTPVTPPFMNWAFNREEEKLKQHWENIPNNADILITHGPPYSILDKVVRNQDNIELVGSRTLENEIFKRIKPKINCFGHIHEMYGIKIKENIKFINASSLNERYEVVNEPIVVDV